MMSLFPVAIVKKTLIGIRQGFGQRFCHEVGRKRDKCPIACRKATRIKQGYAIEQRFNHAECGLRLQGGQSFLLFKLAAKRLAGNFLANGAFLCMEREKFWKVLER
ncbi:MAG: hypothetical protein COW70_01985 [Hydrogenophilales bacterium CG18_big_fil_WC_8_21_14_2_50_58_12]|nr:MAG: hypothetical protein COW70_01985 [Hydrogenophilales bacterium CG18_big_fil_WC_8_21_14_2_50_58_12]